MLINSMFRTSLVSGLLALGVSALSAGQVAKSPNSASFAGKLNRSAFVQNKGQWDSRALFSGAANGMDFWVSKEGFVFQYLRTTKDKSSQWNGHAVGMTFEGANKFTAVGVNKKGIRQYVGGTSSVKTAGAFERVRLSNVYNGVDAVSYFENGTPRYDFIVKPGASPSSINLNFKGASSLNVVDPHKLEIGTVLGSRYQQGLFAYQMVGGKQVPVEVGFKQVDATHVKFNVGAYDKSKPLVIDPLVYGTYYGGDQGYDEVRGVAADSLGSVYLTGYTRSAIYPILFGPFGFATPTGNDAFISRLQGDAYNHDYSILIGGSGNEQGNFIQLDRAGNVFVVGNTTSANFSATPALAGNGNVWILRLAPDANTILTPLNGANPALLRLGNGIAPASISSISSFSMRKSAPPTGANMIRFTLTGQNTATGLPELGAPGIARNFYITYDYDSAANQYNLVTANSSYLATNGAPNTNVSVTGSSYDSNGNLFLNGTLTAPGNSDTAQGANPVWATTPGGYTNSRLQRATDIWVRKYSETGSLTWSNLLGGATADVTEGNFKTHQANGFDIGGTTCATDPAGNVYVLGRSSSFDFPRTRGVFGETFISGENYLTVTKISADGSTILYSTNLRNSGTLTASGIAVDPRGNAYVTGVVSGVYFINGTPPDPVEPNATTSFGNIPTRDPIRAAYTSPATPETRTNDGYLIILNADATDIIRGTYIGGDLDEGVFAPYVDNGGDAWVFGWVDTWRKYTVVSSTGTPTDRPNANGRTGGLAAGFITNLAFKQGAEPNIGQGVVNEAGYFLTGGFGEQGFGMQFRRDGFLLRFRESLPLISNLTLTPATIAGGDPAGLANVPSSTGTITLSAPAPTGGSTITLTVENPAIASFLPSSALSTTTVTVPQGSTTVTFPVYGRVVTSSQTTNVKADYSGNVAIAQLRVIPWLSSLVLTGTNVVGGNSTTGTVTIAAPAPAGGAVVTISSNNSSVVTFPGGNTVTVAPGATTATFAIDTNGVSVTTPVVITGTLLGVTSNATLTVEPARLLRVVFDQPSVAAGGTVTGHVVLNGEAGADMVIDMAVQGSPAGYSIAPTQVTVPAGATISNDFTLTTPFEAADTGRVVTATRRAGAVVIDGPVTGTVQVLALRVSSLVILTSPINSGGATTATVTLASAAPVGGAIVNLYSSRPDIANFVDTADVPISQIVIPAGATTATVNIRALFALNGAVNLTMTAYRGPSPTVPTLEANAPLRVNPLTYTLSVNPSEVVDGANATGTITISAPAIPGFVMDVFCDDPAVTLTPDPVAFTTGATTATFSIATPNVSVTKTVTISAQAGTLPVQSAALTIRALEVRSIQILPSTRVRQNTPIQIRITLNRNATVATSGVLSFSNATLVGLPTVGSTVNFTVNPGSNTAVVTLRTARVPRNLSTTVTAKVGPAAAPSVSTTLFVNR